MEHLHVCEFLAQHTFPMTTASHLIDVAQELSQDGKSLSKLHMERQTAAYKLRYGQAELEHVRLVNVLNQQPSSLNIDESFQKALRRGF